MNASTQYHVFSWVISVEFGYKNYFIERESFHGSDFYLKQKYTISPASSMLSVTFPQIYAQCKIL